MIQNKNYTVAIFSKLIFTDNYTNKNTNKIFYSKYLLKTKEESKIDSTNCFQYFLNNNNVLLIKILNNEPEIIKINYLFKITNFKYLYTIINKSEFFTKSVLKYFFTMSELYYDNNIMFCFINQDWKEIELNFNKNNYLIQGRELPECIIKTRQPIDIDNYNNIEISILESSLEDELALFVRKLRSRHK